jgi:hypothetical protein
LVADWRQQAAAGRSEVIGQYMRVIENTRSGVLTMSVLDGTAGGSLDGAMNKKILAVVLVALAVLVSGGVAHKRRAG